MKKAIQYVKQLSPEGLDLAGLEKISVDMDGFSPKEQFEVLLVIFARFLGTIGDDTSDQIDAGVEPTPTANEPVQAAGSVGKQTPTPPVAQESVEPSDAELQRALADLPAENEYTDAHRETVRQYRSRFARRG